VLLAFRRKFPKLAESFLIGEQDFEGQGTGSFSSENLVSAQRTDASPVAQALKYASQSHAGIPESTSHRRPMNKGEWPLRGQVISPIIGALAMFWILGCSGLVPRPTTPSQFLNDKAPQIQLWNVFPGPNGTVTAEVDSSTTNQPNTSVRHSLSFNSQVLVIAVDAFNPIGGVKWLQLDVYQNASVAYHQSVGASADVNGKVPDTLWITSTTGTSQPPAPFKVTISSAGGAPTFVATAENFSGQSTQLTVYYECTNCTDGVFSPVCGGTSPDSCGSKCVNFQADYENCGSCDHVCGSNETCSSGMCRCGSNPACTNGQTCDGNSCHATNATCPPGLPDFCGSTGCVDLNVNSNNCGACGRACPFPSNEVCVGGTCLCSTGIECEGGCVDIGTDSSNCGSCGNNCGAGVNVGCCNGECCSGADASCCAGIIPNQSSGQCVHRFTDPHHCGTDTACGKDCTALLGSGAICTTTGCACPPGRNICGACIDLTIDPSNCGQCGKTCLGNETCQNGTCVACPADKPIDCNNTCVDTVNDHSNCGSCGSACPQGSVCNNGSCVPCPANQVNCGGKCTNISDDLNNCGICGRACGINQACSSGSCLACAAGQAPCEGLCCPAGLACVGGHCSCPSGFVLCAGYCVETQSNRRNCGGCGITCGISSSCLNGVCVSSTPSCLPPGARCGLGVPCCSGSCGKFGSTIDTCGP